jgi:purine-binding chemotaxis protein CheW
MAFEPRRPAPIPERQLILFSVGTVVYGLPIDRVRAVVNPQTVVELPHAPLSVVGVTDHRGEVVPVIDLRARFALPPLDDPDARRRAKWIMVDVGESEAKSRLIAAVVDVVHNVFMTREVLRPPPPLGGGEDTRGIAGVLSRGNAQGGETGLVFVLDLERLRGLTEPLRGAAIPQPGGAA